MPSPDILLRPACIAIPAVTPMLEDVELRYLLLLLSTMIKMITRNRRAFREWKSFPLIELMLEKTQ